MRTGLTKQEKTTDIWFDEKDPLIHIRTHNTALKKRLLAYSRRYPAICQQTKNKHLSKNRQGGGNMKTKASKYLEIVIESINYIIISYALSNMAMLFQSNPLFILFFASEIWVIGNYWRKVCDMVKNKILAVVLLIICFAIHIGIVYFIGRVVGTVVPFK